MKIFALLWKCNPQWPPAPAFSDEYREQARTDHTSGAWWIWSPFCSLWLIFSFAMPINDQIITRFYWNPEWTSPSDEYQISPKICHLILTRDWILSVQRGERSCAYSEKDPIRCSFQISVLGDGLLLVVGWRVSLSSSRGQGQGQRTLIQLVYDLRNVSLKITPLHFPSFYWEWAPESDIPLIGISPN